MNKGYILKRLIRSVISVIIIMVIVFTLVYTLVPRNSIFAGDDGYRKLAAKPDDKTDYMYNIWQKLGYLNFVRSADYFQELYEMDSTGTAVNRRKETHDPAKEKKSDGKRK